MQRGEVLEVGKIAMGRSGRMLEVEVEAFVVAVVGELGTGEEGHSVVGVHIRRTALRLVGTLGLRLAGKLEWRLGDRSALKFVGRVEQK